MSKANEWRKARQERTHRRGKERRGVDKPGTYSLEEEEEDLSSLSALFPNGKIMMRVTLSRHTEDKQNRYAIKEGMGDEIYS